MYAFNSFVSVPAIILVILYLDNWSIKYDLTMEGIPTAPRFALTIFFCMMCEDFGFHILHRFLHWKVIYPYFHKLHHTYTSTVSVAGEYIHPVDFFFSVLIPGSLGGMILGKHMHYCTFLLWSGMRTFESVDGHSGYEFSWSPYRLVPLSASATYHDFHHSHNVGNYSSFFSFWDTIFGTNAAFYKHQEKGDLSKAVASKLA